MHIKLTNYANRQGFITRQALAIFLVASIPDWSSRADVIQLDNKNFRQYLNADHPVNGSYQLVSDIDLNEIPWTPVGNRSTPFSLTLNGNYHVISNLNVSTSAADTPTGLFGLLHDSTIRNILLNSPRVVSNGTSSPTGALAGEAKRSRIEEVVVNYSGWTETIGLNSHTGGIAGKVSDNSIVRDSLNAGAIKSKAISASLGGIAGLADRKSSITNNVNTRALEVVGTINKISVPAGGIVGLLKNDSIADNNMNTGLIDGTGFSGGIVGKAVNSTISNNLNTGPVDAGNPLSKREWEWSYYPPRAGGIAGFIENSSLVSKNLNVGSVFKRSVEKSGIVAGIAGKSDTSIISQNVNTGTIGDYWEFLSTAAGIAGEASNGTISDNLNAGAVKIYAEELVKDKHIGGGRGNIGGICGRAVYSASVLNNVNTGLVHSLYHFGASARESPIIAFKYKQGRVANNLNIFTGYQRADHDPVNGQNTGVRALSKSTLKSGLNGLNSTLWNAGDTTKLPMPKGVNAPYRVLSRINGTKQQTVKSVWYLQTTSIPLQFPALLKEFATPGGSPNATLFNRTIWNNKDGYLPFPKGFAKPQTLLAGIDCTPGGFACTGYEDITPTPSATPSSSHIAGTSPEAISSPSPLDECPPPEGTPLFQTYDQPNQKMYVVIQPVQPFDGFVLARYNGQELDKQFGLCGSATYTSSASHFGIPESYQPLAGQVIHDATDTHLDLVVTSSSGRTLLLEFPVSAAQKYPAQFSVGFNENVQINDTAHYQGDLYLAGKVDNSLFIGRYYRKMLQYFTYNEKHEEEQASRLRVSPDGKHLYVAGTRRDDEGSYPVFISQHDSQELTPVASFGDNGEKRVTTTDTGKSQQDILVQKDWVYVATVSPQGEKLSIRRFAPDSGQMDGAFIIDDTVGEPLSTPEPFSNVRLMATKDHLHALIYNSEGQLSVVTYKDQVNVQNFNTTFKSPAAKFIRPIFVGNKAYLAVGHVDRVNNNRRHVRILEISLGLQNYMPRKDTRGVSSSGGFPDWGYGVIVGAGVVVIGVVVAAVAAIKLKRKSSSLSIPHDQSHDQPYQVRFSNPLAAEDH